MAFITTRMQQLLPGGTPSLLRGSGSITPPALLTRENKFFWGSTGGLPKAPGSPRQEGWTRLDAGMGLRGSLVPNGEEIRRFSGAAPGLGALRSTAPTHAEQEVRITLLLMWHQENPFPPRAAPTLLSCGV